ncbi:MAG: DMT family transporter [Nitrososphaerota archaeon]|nr:DMT family transporter [Candidatus Bathyarchaeota archaeon]MCX8162244.1 DMT family transporter [Candidatus Bathyarchaeota archaeon]MDW8061252.1 DMT family transporter [Nitrososphaerota archaeon]
MIDYLKVKGRLLLLALTVVWATSFPFTKIAVEAIGYAYYVAFRLVMASIPMLLYGVLRLDFKAIRICLEPGITLSILFLLGIALQGLGMSYTSASNAAFITSLNVVFVYLIEIYYGRSSLDSRIISAICLAILGVYLLSSTDTITFNPGDIIVLIAAFVWALQIVYVGVSSRRFAPSNLLFLEITLSSAGSIPLILLQPPPNIHLILTSLPYIAYLALACTVLANTLQLYGQKIVGNVEASIIYMMEPVFAAIFAYIAIGEYPALKQLAGSIAIMTSLALTIRKS